MKKLPAIFPASMLALLACGVSLNARSSDHTISSQQQPPIPAAAASAPHSRTTEQAERLPDTGAADTAPVEQAGAEQTPDAITGAFGIPLGERFEPSMVTDVLGEQEKSYQVRGGMELKGKLLVVEPGQPDQRFQRYSVKTTSAGIIYAIQGEHQRDTGQDEWKQDEAKRDRARAVESSCKAAVKSLAGELEARYGKPRGKGWGGAWFSFRQISDAVNRSVKLYAHRCRSGMYSVIYTDENVQRRAQPEESVTLPTGRLPVVPKPATTPASQTDATAKP